MYSSPGNLLASNDDAGRYYFSIEDAILEPGYSYCLDLKPYQFSFDTWNSMTIEVEAEPLGDIASFPPDSYSLAEGGDVVLSVLLNRPLKNDFYFGISDGYLGEAEHNDYTRTDYGDHSIVAGQDSFTFQLTTIDDIVEESSERFTVNFNLNGQYGPLLSQSTVTIIDNDAPAPVNRDPLLVIGTIPSAIASQPFAHTVRASDPDGDALNFSLENNPSWLSIGSSDGVIQGTPPDGSDVQGLRVIVNDGAGGEAFSTFAIIVNEAPVINRPPSFNLTSNALPSARMDESYTYSIPLTDPDSVSLSYRLEGHPGWLSISSTGVLEGLPTEEKDYSGIKILVTDDSGNATASPAMTLSVEGPRTEPGAGDRETSSGGGGALGYLFFLVLGWLSFIRTTKRT